VALSFALDTGLAPTGVASANVVLNRFGRNEVRTGRLVAVGAILGAIFKALTLTTYLAAYRTRLPAFHNSKALERIFSSEPLLPRSLPQLQPSTILLDAGYSCCFFIFFQNCASFHYVSTLQTAA